MFFKRITSIPPIPSELLIFDSAVDIELSDTGYGKRFVKDGRLLKNAGYSNSIPLQPELIKWIREHVPGVSQSDITYQVSEHPVCGTHIVHSDINRKYALNYIFETGGHDAYTNWFQEKDKPLHRNKESGNRQSDSGIVNYKNLELLASVRIPINTWVLIATDILHDVDVVIGQRKSITISIKDEEALTKLGLL